MIHVGSFGGVQVDHSWECMDDSLMVFGDILMDWSDDVLQIPMFNWGYLDELLKEWTIPVCYFGGI